MVQSDPTVVHGYAYDQRNLLLHVTRQTGMGPTWPVVDYIYDGAGNRLRQIDYGGSQPVTTTYTNDNSGLSQVLVSDNGETQTANLFGLSLIHQDNGAETRALLADGLGSVRLEMVGGAVDSAATYEPYGNLLARTGASGTVYGFTGEQHDGASGLVYLRARYYNPSLRILMSVDPFSGWQTIPASQHAYAYAHNNPLKYVDPSGYCVDRVTGEVRMSEHPYGTSGLCQLDSTALPLPPSPPPLPTGWPAPPGPVAPLNPFRAYLCAYEVYKDLPNYRVTEQYPFDSSSWLARHDLTSWLVQQMNVNASGPVAQTLRDSLKNGPAGVVAANAGWAAMVRGNGPWDFKPDIIREIGRSIILVDTWYAFDVPANIHYGYVGRSIGFDRDYLLFGAGMAQLQAGTSDKNWGYWYFDDPRDYTAIQVGMDLFDFFGYNLTEDHLSAAIAPRKKLLHQVNALVPPTLDDLRR